MNYFDRIEDYIDGKMTPSDQTAFEEELERNKELQKEVDLHKMTTLVIDQSVKDDIAAEVKSFRKDTDQATSKPSNLRFLYVGLSIAASVALVVSVFLVGGPNQNPTLFAQAEYNTYKPNFSGSRGSEDPSEKVFELLQSEQGKAAEELLLSQDPANDYLLGHALFIQEKYDAAFTAFDVVSKSNQGYDTSQKEGAAFYAALSLMGQGQDKKGLKLLQTIADDEGHAFRSLAQQSLQRWEE